MTAVQHVLDALTAYGCNPKQQGSGETSFRCPAHDDRHASGSLSEGDEGRALIYCHAGCRTEAILERLGLTTSDLFDRGNGHDRGRSREVAAYRYEDEKGHHLFDVVRFDPKDFRQRAPDGTWSTKGIRRVLYRLPAVLAALQDGETVYLVEGEKDADAVNALEGTFIATTCPGGAGKWRAEYSEPFAGSRSKVYIVADRDEPGLKHAKQVLEALRSVGCKARILEPAAGKDVFDHLAQGLPLSALRGQIQGLKVETLDVVLSRPIPKTPWAVEGLLCLGDIAILGGAGGVGKSWISLYVALCLASGKDIFGHLKTVQPYRVAVIDLESRPWEIDQRLHRLALGMRIDPVTAGQHFSLVRERVRLDKPTDVERLLVSLTDWGTEVVIIDSMRRTHGGDENSSTDTSNLFLEALDPIRTECGCAVILTDHIRKRTGDKEMDSPAESLRGSTDKFNLSDLVIGAERREDRIAIFPSKGRHRGAPLQPFLVEFSGFGPEDEEEAPVTARYVGPLDIASDASQDVILTVVEAEGGEKVPRGTIIGKVGKSARTVASGLRALVDRGRLIRHREAKQVTYSLVKGWTDESDWLDR